MGDPDVDHGFVFDDQGRMGILASPFFDVHFGNDETADDYVDRILYQLTLAIEAQIPPGRWYAEAGTLMNNYAHIFDLLTRLRQACCLLFEC
ncbi:hypothetical protein M5K25_019504 [Dendrobium thyrsiflorum]|uniref:Uncharacterized protein n=1 Tax=Dendrobium thyrsiflorum TaxID=117978 RepID=A0ABD0UM78_DENTH